MVTERTLADNIYGGGLQARLWLAHHIRGPRPQIHHDITITGQQQRRWDPTQVPRIRAIRAERGSRHFAISSAEACQRLLLKACPEHKPRGETGAAQEEGEGTGFADALARMLGRGRART